MGMHHFSSSSYDKPTQPNVTVNVTLPKLPNPNPKNFRILSYFTMGRYLVVKVNYPDCTNYEGDKVLLYRDTTLEGLEAQGSIDPHFSNNANFHSPIARFVPTVYGWRMACRLARMENKNDISRD
jgi:hypothetical protein